jgi:hypothetical protein
MKTRARARHKHRNSEQERRADAQRGLKTPTPIRVFWLPIIGHQRPRWHKHRVNRPYAPAFGKPPLEAGAKIFQRASLARAATGRLRGRFYNRAANWADLGERGLGVALRGPLLGRLLPGFVAIPTMRCSGLVPPLRKHNDNGRVADIVSSPNTNFAHNAHFKSLTCARQAGASVIAASHRLPSVNWRASSASRKQSRSRSETPSSMALHALSSRENLMGQLKQVLRFQERFLGLAPQPLNFLAQTLALAFACLNACNDDCPSRSIVIREHCSVQAAAQTKDVFFEGAATFQDRDWPGARPLPAL